MGLRQQAASIQKIKVDFSKVPDWSRRATRMSIAIVFFGMLGHCLQFDPADQVFATNFRQSCNWAAITCIVVTAPLIGKVAQVAFDRLLGTAMGGFIGCVCFTIGFHLFGTLGGGVFISLVAGLVVWITTYIAFKYSMDQLVRFIQLTYVIVAFGAKPDKGALIVALLRVGGIFAGGLLSVLLAVLVLPRSASIDCMLEMKRALKALHDLNQEVWLLSGVVGPPSGRRLSRKSHRHGYSALQLLQDANDRLQEEAKGASASVTVFADAAAIGAVAMAQPAWELRSGGVGGSSGNTESSFAKPDGLRRGLNDRGFNTKSSLELLMQHDNARDSHEAAIEKLFTAVYSALGRVDDHLAQTRGEIYIWHFWGRYFFLPGVHWFPVRGRWGVPRQDLEDMATCIRRVARMLWTLQLDFNEGFGAEMESVLHRYYPHHLLSELANYQARAILDLLHAFPGGTTVEVDNLFTLGQVTDCLLQISDARARNVVFKVKRGAAAAASTVSPGTYSRRQSCVDLTLGASAVAAAPVGVAGGVAETLREPEKRHLAESSHFSSEAGLSRGPGTDSHAGAAGVVGEADHPSASDLEKQPLLPGIAASPQVAQATATAAANDPLLPLPNLSSGPAGPSGVYRCSSGGLSGGMFVSRLLSCTPGEAVSIHLPPRKYMQQQQQQQQQQQVESSETGNRDLAVAAATLVQLPLTPSCSSSLENRATSPTRRAAARPPSLPPLVPPTQQQVPPLSNPAAPSLFRPPQTPFGSVVSVPGLDELFASRPSAFGTSEDPSATDPLRCGPATGWMDLPDTARAAALPVDSFTHSPTLPATDTVIAVAPSGLGVPPESQTPPAPRQTGLLPEFPQLSGMTSWVPVEAVNFPPTEEGYLAQVRWYSFQFVMDEMVNELEEAFHACSAVMQKLPYPIGNSGNGRVAV